MIDGGIMTQAAVSPGEQVAAGQVQAQLDTSLLKPQVAQAEAILAATSVWRVETTDLTELNEA
jgi:multidrug efflux pump subunit AcrA (membrane-fusion protein)